MKTNQLMAIVFSIAISTLVLINGCDSKKTDDPKDPCSGVQCGANMYCDSGSCVCSTGFVHENCDSSVSAAWIGTWKVLMKGSMTKAKCSAHDTLQTFAFDTVYTETITVDSNAAHIRFNHFLGEDQYVIGRLEGNQIFFKPNTLFLHNQYGSYYEATGLVTKTKSFNFSFGYFFAEQPQAFRAYDFSISGDTIRLNNIVGRNCGPCLCENSLEADLTLIKQ